MKIVHTQLHNDDILIEQAPRQRISFADVALRLLAVSVILAASITVAARNERAVVQPGPVALGELCGRMGR